MPSVSPAEAYRSLGIATWYVNNFIIEGKFLGSLSDIDESVIRLIGTV